MPTIPKATVSIDATAGPGGTGSQLIAIIAPAVNNADGVPRVFGSGNPILSFHGYGEGAEYAALHTAETGLPVIFCGIPIAVAGVIGSENTSGNTNTCVTTVTAGSDGVLAEHDGEIVVVNGGTVGTDQIVFNLSMDGGRSYQRVRLGTDNSYVVPYHDVTINFGAGDLTAGETIHTWHGSQPIGDASGITLARTQLAAQQRQIRDAILIGDAPDSTYANAALSFANDYATSNERFVKIRVQAYDQQTPADLSNVTAKMSSTTVTFAEVGATGDTITRTAGSFITDGFQVGDLVTISNTPSGTNDFVGAAAIIGVTATVLTLDTDDLEDQGPVTATITAQRSVTFDNAGETLTLSGGSWLDDGFRVGQEVTIADSVSNNGTFTIQSLSATVMTLDTGDVSADEVIGANVVSITAGQTKTEWLTAAESSFASIDSAPRISLGLGRGRKLSPLTGYTYRRPVQWAASVRQYQHDYPVATWRKDLGSLPGWSLDDGNGTLEELDDRVDGSVGLGARFTTFRTWANGPGGVFIALDLTRAADSTILSYCHNKDVVNLAQTTVHAATEALIGQLLILKTDGSGQATTESLNTIQRRVQTQLDRVLLRDIGEGPRASGATWTPNADDDLSGAEANLTGVLLLTLNGTIHSVTTTIKVQ